VLSFNLPSPLQKLKSGFLDTYQLEVFVKREDLIHPVISGNKWRKLKGNLEEALKENHPTVLTFGGAYSNHIAATAFACQQLGLRSIGVIRGQELKDDSKWGHTLKQAAERGMQFHFVDRQSYRQKEESTFIELLKKKWGDFYLIPEGGANEAGVKGCEEILDEISPQFDYICLSAGTGTTAAGLLRKLMHGKLLVFPALKEGEFLETDILKWQAVEFKSSQLQLITDYHFGGYGKSNRQLEKFSREFYGMYGFELDRVYTAKLFYGVVDMMRKNFFAAGSKLLLIHTGGLQGNASTK
jgi:1-aminocyclopropane-1-carboxylate deaminase